MDTEIERERYVVPKAGDKIRMSLVATNTDRETRMRNGVTQDDFEGIAKTDLREGERFRLDIGYDVLNTSTVVRVGKGIFTTKNSTYSFELLSSPTPSAQAGEVGE